MLRLLCVLMTSVALSACSVPPEQVLFTPTASKARISSSVPNVLVNSVSLPAYAEASEITVQADSGLLQQVPNIVWADDPSRALTNALVRHLTEITGVTVAAEPWPLNALPDGEVTVRVDQLAVLKGGDLTLTGQFSIRYDDLDRREKVALFDLTQPLTDTTPAAIAAGYDAIWITLAERIAKKL